MTAPILRAGRGGRQQPAGTGATDFISHVSRQANTFAVPEQM